MTTNTPRDTSSEPGNAGHLLPRRPSALPRPAFAPARPWTPDPAAAAFEPRPEVR